MAHPSSHTGTPQTSGHVIHSLARVYDLLAWFILRGREPTLREKMVDLAALKSGETVLDVGCGTGTLLIAAKRRIGASGRAFGIDPSPEMIARAQKKAKKLGAEITFRVGVIESLPFPDGYCDAVLSTLMIYHLLAELRECGAREIARVLKPGGRVLAVDFGEGDDGKHGLFSYFTHSHRHVSTAEMRAMFGQAGLNITDSGAVGMANLHYVLAVA